MFSSNFSLPVATLLLALSLGAPAFSSAAQCFDVITTNTKLTGDVTCACGPDSALTVVGPAELNLNGHTVSCNDAATRPPQNFPSCVLIVGDGAVVRNGEVTGCSQGVAGMGSNGNTIKDIVAVDNEVGIIFEFSNDNTINNVQVFQSLVAGVLTIGGDNNVVKNSYVSQVLLFEGIAVLGNNSKIVNNTVEDVFGASCMRISPIQGVIETPPLGGIIKNNAVTRCGQQGMTVFASDTVISGNDISNTNSSGILAGVSGMVIKNNFIKGTGSDGIGFTRGDAVIANNIIEDVAFGGIDIYDFAVDTVVKGNSVDTCGREGIEIETDGHTVKNNVITNCEDGIGLPVGADNNVVKNNEVSMSTNVDLIDGNPNCGSNTWKNNWFTSSNVACVA